MSDAMAQCDVLAPCNNMQKPHVISEIYATPEKLRALAGSCWKTSEMRENPMESKRAVRAKYRALTKDALK